jgi:hypothetical protein
MRQVAGSAALGLHGRMFEHPRPLKIPMAFEADGVLFLRNAQGARHGAAVHVVAIGALKQALVNPVPEGFAEISLLLCVAAVAELWLLLDQQAALLFRKVGRVARDAAHAGVGMSRAQEIGVFLLQRVARQAAFTDDFWRLILEHENLGLVTAAVNVLSSGSMAGFTAVGFVSFFGFQEAVPMPCLLKTIENIFVAGFACVGAHVLR